MKTIMKSGPDCRDLVADVEGRSNVAYWDKWAKIWTIGIGHTGPEVVKGLVWSDQQIDEAFRFDIMEAELVVNNAVKTRLTQCMFDALVSFAFNVGPGKRGIKDGFVSLKSGGPSTMLKLLNIGAFESVTREFVKWNRAGGMVVNGLTIRREKEAKLYARDRFPVLEYLTP